MLRWRLLGINFCIRPSFWVMNALWAYMLYAYQFMAVNGRSLPNPFTAEFLEFMLIWIGCILVCVMVHELGHVISGKIFGQAGNITLTGLGGQAVGDYGELRPWQRILVIFAGPGAGFAFVALTVAVDGFYWNLAVDWLNWPDWLKVKLFWIDHVNPLLRMDRPARYELILQLLFFIGLFVNMMNLLPIIPMDGGMIFKEVCCLIAPRAGLKFAFIWSFFMATAVTLYMLTVVLVNYRYLPETLPVYYPFAFPEFTLIVFGMMAYQSLQAYRQLAAIDRHSEYAQEEW